MGYRTLAACVDDLAASGQLVRIDTELDARLEVAQIQRRAWAAGGPALLFTNVRGCRFPMLANLFGTIERMRYLFRDTLSNVERLIELKIDPTAALRRPWHYLSAARLGLAMRPRTVRSGAVLGHETTIDQLPQLVSWPCDGGPFITLPQVYTEHPDRPGWRHANLGMYRVQLGGNRYQTNREIGLHYQIHRGIGIHHTAALAKGEPLRVSIWIGGPPALAVSAVMPLPENVPELTFAGALGGHRVPLIAGATPIHAEADFCITGTIDPTRLLPEGPFGDHLGYYAKQHDFPVLRVEHVYHRSGAIWPFTTVGRPPQEDTAFGQFIHELTGPIVPTVVPGVKAVHAVDASGVHPLMLAIGSERYAPYADRARPAELLTQAHAILGQGQMSLAKYLLIINEADDRDLDIQNVAGFVQHLLARVDWTRDLHFQTCTTIDTLDYSGTALNEGSKLVIAAVGPPRRELSHELPPDVGLPTGFDHPQVALPGVVVISGPRCDDAGYDRSMNTLVEALRGRRWLDGFPLVVVVDDSQFAAESLNNWLWVTFTRSDPARDVYGVESFVEHKHWGCRGPLVIDARLKPHHAAPLEEDPEVTRRVDALAVRGGPLHGLI